MLKKPYEMQVYGEDLARLEGEREELEAQRKKVSEKTFMLPSKRKELLADLDDKIGSLNWQISSAQEHVRSDPISSKFHADTTEKRKLAKEAEAAQKDPHHISAAKLAEIEKRENERLAKEVKTGQEKSKEAMAYLAEAKKDSAKKPPDSKLSAERKRDLEWEPGDD